MDLFIKLAMLVVFFGSMIYVGLYCRRHATDVNGLFWVDAALAPG